MDSFQQAEPEGYIHETHIVKGKGHWMDRARYGSDAWMTKYKRNALPERVWRQEEVVRPSCTGWE